MTGNHPKGKEIKVCISSIIPHELLPKSCCRRYSWSVALVPVNF
jgi:hypothetical protein